MKTIRDPIHGDIELSEAELAVVDTPAFQRLRRIRQLSFCSLVYPGANHTRFEHSLGTMHLAGRIARRLGLEEEPLRMAGLVHDLGHIPFSHSLEGVFNTSHERNLKLVMKGEVGDIINDSGFDVRKILNLVRGRGPGKIISSEIDADRMDYLLRDSHYTGVAYGVIDADRIINVIGFDGREVFFHKKGLIALEALLIGRNQMYEAVYFHHTVRIADTMLQEAMRRIADKITIGQLLRMGDDDLRFFAKQDRVASELLELLDRRRLYKTAFSVRGGIDRQILLDKSGLKPHQLLISSIRLTGLEFSILIKDDSELKEISRVSRIAKELREEIKNLEETEVYVPPQYKDKLKFSGK